jgi:hypothetical protein
MAFESAVRALESAVRAHGYRRAWVVDTEYCSFGIHPRARCLCALDILSGERREVWLAGVADPPCPFAMTDDELFIFWAADADVGIFIALGWPVPQSVLDTRVEFMRIRCGLPPLPSIDTENDPDMAGPAFLFTAPAWMRFLLVPPKGRAVGTPTVATEPNSVRGGFTVLCLDPPTSD